MFFILKINSYGKLNKQKGEKELLPVLTANLCKI